MRTIRNSLVLAIVPLLLVELARADRVTLTDGSEIVGTVERIADGKLTIITDFAGKLVIDTAKVKAITSEQKMNVAFTSGDQLLGTLAPTPDGSQTTVASAVATAAVSTAQITALWPEGAPSPEQIAADKAIAAAKPVWTASLEGGIVATEGNSDTMNANARGELLRKTTMDLLKFYAQADYGEQDDERNKSQYIAGARYEHTIPHRWWQNWGGPFLWYVRTEFEYDEFENLDLRATVAGGLGHYWIKKENHALTTRVGAGYRHQAFMDDTTTDDPILDAGFDYRYDIRDWASFTHSTTYNPSLEDFGDYLLVLDTGLAFPIAKSEKWKFKVGVRNEYNSDPQPEAEDLDNTYYANIRLDFK